MKAEFFGEEPSLTVLFGDDVENEIQAVAAEMNLPVSAVRSAVKTFAPQLLGEETEAAPGSKFGNVFKAIAEGVGSAAPGIAAAIKGTPAMTTTAPAPQPEFNLQSMIIPAGIAALILFLIMKK